MSLLSLSKCVDDAALRDRVEACIIKIARTPEAFGEVNGPFSSNVRSSVEHVTRMLPSMMWTLALLHEAAYATALGTTPQGETPGMNEALITDAAIQTSVLANWPDV